MEQVNKKVLISVFKDTDTPTNLCQLTNKKVKNAGKLYWAM